MAASQRLAPRMPAERVVEIIKGPQGITPDEAARLGQAFHTTPEFWLKLQAIYDRRMRK